MKRKTVLLLLLVGLALSMLSACSTAQTEATAEATTEATAEATTEATTEATVEATTEATTEATAEATTEATVEATTEATTEAAAGADPLLFPVDSYVETTQTVTTSAGTVEVTYRLYEHIPYVANPVDVEYQSLDVKVPVMIDGQEIDATNAPILFVIGVGGYMSVNNVSGGSAGGMGGGVAAGGVMTGTLPEAMTGNLPGGGAPGGGGDSGVSGSADLALAAGYVVVEPGTRGRDNQAEDGTYFGKAPAAIVDLKAAIRYIRYNDDILPGNADWIISRGVSAGGALSALLGASGDSDLYDTYLAEIGAADADDTIYASADFCPITDLENADMAYEWQLGTASLDGEQVDQALSQELGAAFVDYQTALNLQGEADFGTITADNYGEYLVQTYLLPAANKYLLALTDEERETYLAENSWITWADDSATFTFEDYSADVGRMKSLPAFDAFDLSSGENGLFGNETTDARHFTDWSIQQASGDATATIDEDVNTLVDLMNPMYFIAQGCEGCADYWWIRHGTADNNTALTVITNLAISLANSGQDVNTSLYWDAGHGADEDPEEFIAWIGEITGYSE